VQRLAPSPAASAPTVRHSAAGLLILVLLQIYVGALVAGLDAGQTYNTWPLVDGALVPPGDRLFLITPAWRNFFENHLTVQFTHRMLAYLLWLGALLHAVHAWRGREPARASAAAVAVLVTAQAALGIATLLQQAPIGLSLLHQGMALLVLTAAVLHAARTAASAPRSVSAEGVRAAA
jgi:heme a synthase